MLTQAIGGPRRLARPGIHSFWQGRPLCRPIFLLVSGARNDSPDDAEAVPPMKTNIGEIAGRLSGGRPLRRRREVRTFYGEFGGVTR